MGEKIRIICVGKVKEAYLREGISEYEKRLRPFCKLETIELKDEGIEKEGKRIEKLIDSNTFLLDVEGKEYNSIEFSKLMKKETEGGKQITFIIGSAEGIEENLKKKANLFSLSKMTFTHEMARLFLIEQIYRSYMINSGRSYHK